MVSSVSVGNSTNFMIVSLRSVERISVPGSDVLGRTGDGLIRSESTERPPANRFLLSQFVYRLHRVALGSVLTVAGASDDPLSLEEDVDSLADDELHRSRQRIFSESV